MIQQPLTVHTS